MTTATRRSREASTDAVRAGRRDLHVLRVGEIRIDLAPGQAGPARARCQGARPGWSQHDGGLSPLTNTAYGFPRGKTRRIKPVALACIHITGNSHTAAYTDLHAAARAERNYANRSGSNGPSATHYIARDGWTLEAIDWRRYAAWSNGDVNSPHTTNAGIRRVLVLRAKGYNANEAYWLETENVGYRSTPPDHRGPEAGDRPS